MWKYKPEYDTRESNEFECYDVDTRLGEELGATGFIDTLSEYTDKDNHQIVCNIQQCFNKGYGVRNFNRHVRKRHIKPYLKIRRVDLTSHRVIGVCRLSIFEPEYITGYNEDMILSNDEIDKFIEIMSSKPFLDESCKPFWEEVIQDINNHYKVNRNKYHIPRKLKMPDYTKLKELF